MSPSLSLIKEAFLLFFFIVSINGFPTRITTPMLATTQPSTDICGNNQYIILNDAPWIVYNMLYNAAVTVGTQCTCYDHVDTPTGSNQEVVWSSITNIDYVQSTYVVFASRDMISLAIAMTLTRRDRSNVPKGYSFVGLTKDLETTISGIDSIPASYHWTRSNTTTFKGMFRRFRTHTIYSRILG